MSTPSGSVDALGIHGIVAMKRVAFYVRVSTATEQTVDDRGSKPV